MKEDYLYPDPTDAVKQRILSMVCVHLNFDIELVRSKTRKTEAAYARKIYCYLTRMFFPNTCDRLICDYIHINKSLAGLYVKTINERIYGRIKNHPDSIQLKKDIEEVKKMIIADRNGEYPKEISIIAPSFIPA